VKRAFAVAAVVFLAVAFGAGAAGAALIYSCDFEQGNSGFSSGYTYNHTDYYSPAVYDVNTNPNLHHRYWASYTAHAGSLMMIVNGGTDPAALLWAPSAPIPVLANSDYTLSVWVASSYSQNPAVLSWSVNGVPLAGTFTASTTTGVWQLYETTWNSGGSTTAALRLFDLSGQFQGNDFTIDDIAFSGSPVPIPGTLALMGSGLLGLILTGARRRNRR